MILVDTSVWIDHLRVIDAHLLAAVSLAGPARLWTRDKRLGAVAADLGLVSL